jgi:hypothetical protein
VYCKTKYKGNERKARRGYEETEKYKIKVNICAEKHNRSVAIEAQK